MPAPQPPLFPFEMPKGGLVRPPSVEGQTIQERFESFHKLNPWVYEALAVLAGTYVRSGRKHIGMKHLCEIVRWEYFKATRGDDFRLNNNWTSRYARLLLEKHPEYEGVIEFRRLRAA